MNEPQTPHDHFFRYAFSHLEQAFAPDLATRLDEIAALIQQAQHQTALEFFIVVLRYLATVNDKMTTDIVRRVVRKGLPAQEEKVMANMASEWTQKGVEQGEQQALERWTQRLLRSLERKWGPLRPTVKQRLYVLPAQQVEQLTDAMLDFKKKSDVTKWLDESERPAGSDSVALN